MTVLVFSLAVALLAWGMQYKTSLYSPPGSASTRVPSAKLLSQEERPASVQGFQQFSSPVQPQICILGLSAFLTALISLFVYAVQADRIWIAANEDGRRKRHFRGDFFSFRPPPAFLLLQ